MCAIFSGISVEAAILACDHPLSCLTAQQLWHAKGLEVTYLTAESLASRVWDAFATRKDLLFYGWQPSEGQAQLCSPRRCHGSFWVWTWIITERTERERAWDPLRFLWHHLWQLRPNFISTRRKRLQPVLQCFSHWQFEHLRSNYGTHTN